MAGIEELLDAKMEAEPDGPAPWDDVKKEEMEAKPKVSLAEKSKPAPRFAFNVADLTPDNFRDVVYQQVSEMIDYFGGPTQYLESKLSGEGAQAAFASDLLAAFPRKPDLRYQEFPLPRDTSVVNTMHLSDLGYGDTFSSKPKPFAHTCEALLDEFVTNGFISASPDLNSAAPSFWMKMNLIGILPTCHGFKQVLEKCHFMISKKSLTCSWCWNSAFKIILHLLFFEQFISEKNGAARVPCLHWK